MFRTHLAPHQERQIVSIKPLVAVNLKIGEKSKLQSYILKDLHYRWMVIYQESLQDAQSTKYNIQI